MLKYFGREKHNKIKSQNVFIHSYIMQRVMIAHGIGLQLRSVINIPL